jgi:hypothetical protein
MVILKYPLDHAMMMSVWRRTHLLGWNILYDIIEKELLGGTRSDWPLLTEETQDSFI